jgi:hypothetical protein
MLRCALVLALAAIACAPAAAQVARNFPANALRGELIIDQAPEARLNGKPARLAPGVRIRDRNNMLVVSGAASGEKLPVHYTLDTLGLVREVWILRADELANKPWPTSPQEAQAWAFDPVAQRWTKP